MRVKAEKYYIPALYHDHETVCAYVHWANALSKDDTRSPFEKRVAHQIKCFILKRYRRNNGAEYLPLCKEWAEQPAAFFTWLTVKAKGPQETYINSWSRRNFA